MIRKKFKKCPLNEWRPCMEDECAWWDETCCSVFRIAVSLEILEDNNDISMNGLIDVFANEKVGGALDALAELPGIIDRLADAVGGDDE